jgi:hypothetical protein
MTQKSDWRDTYRAVKLADYHLYQQVVESASAIGLNNNLSLDVMAQIEVAMMYLVHQTMRVK